MMSGGEGGKNWQNKSYHLDISSIQYHQKPDITAMLASAVVIKYNGISIRYVVI